MSRLRRLATLTCAGLAPFALAGSATPAPASVMGPGRCPWRSHSHSTTAAGAVYSISNAGATCMCWTAEK